MSFHGGLIGITIAALFFSKKNSVKLFNKYDEIINLVNSSKRPIILAGHGIRLSKASKDFTKMCKIL